MCTMRPNLLVDLRLPMLGVFWSQLRAGTEGSRRSEDASTVCSGSLGGGTHTWKADHLTSTWMGGERLAAA